MNLLAILILTATLIWRLFLYLFNYPDLNSLDPSLEYLVSSHILKYHEFPWVGTTASGGTVSINSPLYYYFLSLFLVIYRSVFTLNALNILLQTGMTILMWDMARKKFGPWAGLLTILFVSLSSWGMQSSRFFFQPYVSQPFFFLSAYLLLRGCAEKNIRFAYGSIVAFIVSASFYLSTLLYLPLYLIGLGYTLGHARTPAGRYIRAILIGLASIAVSFGSVIAAALRQPDTLSRSAFVFTPALSGYGERLLSYIVLLRYSLFYSNELPLLMGVVVASILFFAGRRSAGEKKYALLILLLSSVPVLVLPLFSVPPAEHYLHISVAFNLIYLAVILTRVVFANRGWTLIGIPVMAFVLLSLSGNFHYRTSRLFPTAQKAAGVIARELDDLAKEGDVPTVSFFQFKAGLDTAGVAYNLNDDYLFYHLLEEKTGRKLVSTSIYHGIPQTPANTEYLFLTCLGASKEGSTLDGTECLPYMMERMAYIPVREVFSQSPFTVYLMRSDGTEGRYIYLGASYFTRQKFSESEGAYRKALEINAKNPDALAGLGNVLIKQNRLDEAGAVFRRIFPLDRTNASAHVGLGRVAYMRGNYQEAERLFLSAIRFHPDDTAAYFDLGKLYRVLRRHDQSEQAFSQALAINPKDIGMLFGLSYLYMQYREFDKAEQTLKNALSIDPTYDGLYVALGDVYLRTRRFNLAEEMYTKAREINPGSDLFIGLSELYMQTGRQKEAEALLKKSIEINPKSDRYQGLGSYYYQTGRLEEAIPMFEKAIAINPKGNGYIGLGTVYENQGKYALAEETFTRALPTPYKAQAQLALGSLYMTMHRYDEAETLLKLVTFDEEMRHRAYATLGDLYLLLGRRSEAKSAYLKFQELDPGNPEVQERLNQLQ